MARALKVFMRGKSITLLQEVLRRMGYEINDQRGLFGTMTRDAVKNFQKQKSLKPTGIVDDELMKLMRHGEPTTEKKEAKTIKVEAAKPSVNQEQLDALIRLLIKKGVLADGELEAEMNKVIPTSL